MGEAQLAEFIGECSGAAGQGGRGRDRCKSDNQVRDEGDRVRDQTRPNKGKKQNTEGGQQQMKLVKNQQNKGGQGVDVHRAASD